MTQRPRLLILDDDRACAEGVADLVRFRLPEIEVEVQHDPVAALRQIVAGRYQIVLTDVQMPRLDGLQLLAILQGARPDVPVILMTGVSGISPVQAPAAEAVLAKPLDRDLLTQTLRSGMGRLPTSASPCGDREPGGGQASSPNLRSQRDMAGMAPHRTSAAGLQLI